ncbi:hypothetical protein GUJ93_ZPchr0016g2585 [Zizania palustris]|uniref:Uncharacterized protein n=1 Tax=Zizania palustris TaxID=103762 RepID=A0A8J5SZ25_ZIZPA|nr:hypothetical protein GUJ93_ZPchr0016g2585 [Zizania palustris]
MSSHAPCTCSALALIPPGPLPHLLDPTLPCVSHLIRQTALALAAAFFEKVKAAPSPMKLRLEPPLPPKGMPMEYLREQDRVRHDRRGLLRGSFAVDGVVGFLVEGSVDPFMFG